MATIGGAQGKVLLLGTYQSMVAATRLLGEAGYTVIAGLSERLPTFVEHSRHARETWKHPAAAHGAEAFATAVSGFLADRPDITTVLPMGDLEISALVDHAPTLPPTTVLAMQPAEAVRTCENKIALMRLADSLDIPQAPYALVDTGEALVSEAERIGFPCIAKAPNSATQVLGKRP